MQHLKLMNWLIGDFVFGCHEQVKSVLGPIVNAPDNNSSTPYLTCKSLHIVLEVDQLPQPQTQKGTAINDEKEIEQQF